MSTNEHSPTEQDLVHQPPLECPRRGCWVLDKGFALQTTSHLATLIAKAHRAMDLWGPTEVPCSLPSSIGSNFMFHFSVPAPRTVQILSCLHLRGRTKAQARFMTWPFMKPRKGWRKLMDGLIHICNRLSWLWHLASLPQTSYLVSSLEQR